MTQDCAFEFISRPQGSIGLADKLPEVLEEAMPVLKELGWPKLITRFAQIIGTQALMNVMRGDRYVVVPDVLKKYVLGHFGKLTVPVDPEVFDKIIEKGSKKITLGSAQPEPLVPGLRRRYPGLSDEERLLRHMFPGSQVDDMLAAPPINEHYTPSPAVIRLLSALLERSDFDFLSVENGSERIELTRSAS